MSILRCSLLEARNLGRTLGIWPFLALALWSLVIKLQEPDFFAREGVPFYWASLESVLLFGFGLLPLSARLCQGPEHGPWTERLSPGPASLVVISWLSVLCYGLVLALVSAPIFYTVHRILGKGSPSWSPQLDLLLSALGFLAITASLASVLARARSRTPTLVCGWLLFLALALQLFGPVTTPGAGDFSSSTLTSRRFFGILSTLCATLGGLAFSLAHTLHRPHRPRI